jgi:hypothetical protein
MQKGQAKGINAFEGTDHNFFQRVNSNPNPCRNEVCCK